MPAKNAPLLGLRKAVQQKPAQQELRDTELP